MYDVGEMVPVAQEDVRQDLQAMFRGAIRASLEMFLEAELESLVGAQWYARVGGRRDLPQVRQARMDRQCRQLALRHWTVLGAERSRAARTSPRRGPLVRDAVAGVISPEYSPQSIHS